MNESSKKQKFEGFFLSETKLLNYIESLIMLYNTLPRRAINLL